MPHHTNVFSIFGGSCFARPSRISFSIQYYLYRRKAPKHISSIGLSLARIGGTLLYYPLKHGVARIGVFLVANPRASAEAPCASPTGASPCADCGWPVRSARSLPCASYGTPTHFFSLSLVAGNRPTICVRLTAHCGAVPYSMVLGYASVRNHKNYSLRAIRVATKWMFLLFDVFGRPTESPRGRLSGGWKHQKTKKFRGASHPPLRRLRQKHRIFA